MPVFVDSNVIVYAKDSADPAKQQRAEAWISHLWQTRSGRLSTQVLQEAYAVMRRKLAGSAEDHRLDLVTLFAWQPLVVGPDTIEAAWALEDRYSLSFWDGLILAAAAASRCETLLSEDLAHGESYGTVRVLDPFRQPPPA